MLVDGKTFNGQTVIGIGLTMAVHIYFRAMERYQTSTTDFPASEQALQASCRDLRRTLSESWQARRPSPSRPTAAHSWQGHARGEDEPSAGSMRLPADSRAGCAGNLRRVGRRLAPGLGVEHGRMDDDQSRRQPEWPGYNWTTRGELPDARAGSAEFAFAHRGGTCLAGGDYSGTFSIQSPTVQMPAGPNVKLRFDHYVETEPEYDGGNVLVSVKRWSLPARPRRRLVG